MCVCFSFIYLIPCNCVGGLWDGPLCQFWFLSVFHFPNLNFAPILFCTTLSFSFKDPMKTYQLICPDTHVCKAIFPNTMQSFLRCCFYPYMHFTHTLPYCIHFGTHTLSWRTALQNSEKCEFWEEGCFLVCVSFQKEQLGGFIFSSNCIKFLSSLPSHSHRASA